MNVYNAWTDSTYDNQMIVAAKESTAQLQNVAAADGVLGSFSYVNYAIYDTPLEAMYGDNVQRLKEIKHRVDPQNIMNLAGGFRF
jgi:FAD/FMN-containing dehydrogenase